MDKNKLDRANFLQSKIKAIKGLLVYIKIMLE